MGADNNLSTTNRLSLLQSRKQTLEEKITSKNNELRSLCIQEAELTGIMPVEIPLEPGETLPAIRRRIGTAFEYPQNVITNVVHSYSQQQLQSQPPSSYLHSHSNSFSCQDEEAIIALQTQIQVQQKIAEAALQLANNATITKSIKRKNMSLYNQTKQQLVLLEEKLEHLKITQTQNQQLKQRKKPRPPLESAGNISGHNDELNIGCDVEMRKHTQVQMQEERCLLPSNKQFLYKKFNSSVPSIADIREDMNSPNYGISDDGLSFTSTCTTFRNKLKNHHQQHNNNYNNNRRSTESNNNILSKQPYQLLSTAITTVTTTAGTTTSSALQSRFQYPTDNYRSGYFENVDANANASLNTVNYKHVNYVELNQQYLPYPSADACVTPGAGTGLGGHWIQTENGETVWHSTTPTTPETNLQVQDDVHRVWQIGQIEQRFGSLDRRKGKYMHSKRLPPCLDSLNKHSTLARSNLNSCHETQRLASASISMPTQTPIITLSKLHSIPNNIIPCRKHNNRHLVRTQSLGSVGAQTMENVWPSDDNSSFDDSDGLSMNERNSSSVSRKLKQKGWYETSLDSPALSVPTTVSYNAHHLMLPLQLSLPSSSPVPLPLPLPPKPILEIPAESNPSPTLHPEASADLFSNNVLNENLPKHCTVVQAGHCKPYREVTKPFEMSDFYKYSTKFRERQLNANKTLIKYDNNLTHETQDKTELDFGNMEQNIQQHFKLNDQNDCERENNDLFQKSIYQPLQPMKCQPVSLDRGFRSKITTPATTTLPTTTTLTSIAVSVTSPCADNTNIQSNNNATFEPATLFNSSNVAEHFSTEMNIWYQNHGHDYAPGHLTSKNNSVPVSSSSTTTATLV